MPLIDDRGRLFGRLNIVDAAVLVVVALLIPLAYGAYLIFRPPPARLLALEPARVPFGTTEVAVRGEHLRPYLRLVVGTQGTTFLFADTNGGVLQLPELAAGAYDVVLFDEGAELSRLRNALVVEPEPVVSPSPPPPPPPPPPTTTIVAVGRFAPADAERAGALTAVLQQAQGRSRFDWGQVLGVQPSKATGAYLPRLAVPFSDSRYSTRAVVRFRCELALNSFRQADCRVNDVSPTPGVTIVLEVGTESATFQVDQLHPVYSTSVEILMRSNLSPDEITALRDWRSEEGADFPALAALRPSLISFEVIGNGLEPAQVIAMVRLRVPAVETSRGWVHGHWRAWMTCSRKPSTKPIPRSRERTRSRPISCGCRTSPGFTSPNAARASLAILKRNSRRP